MRWVTRLCSLFALLVCAIGAWLPFFHRQRDAAPPAEPIVVDQGEHPFRTETLRIQLPVFSSQDTVWMLATAQTENNTTWRGLLRTNIGAAQAEASWTLPSTPTPTPTPATRDRRAPTTTRTPRIRGAVQNSQGDLLVAIDENLFLAHANGTLDALGSCRELRALAWVQSTPEWLCVEGATPESTTPPLRAVLFRPGNPAERRELPTTIPMPGGNPPVPAHALTGYHDGQHWHILAENFNAAERAHGAAVLYEIQETGTPSRLGILEGAERANENGTAMTTIVEPIDARSNVHPRLLGARPAASRLTGWSGNLLLNAGSLGEAHALWNEPEAGMRILFRHTPDWCELPNDRLRLAPDPDGMGIERNEGVAHAGLIVGETLALLTALPAPPTRIWMLAQTSQHQLVSLFLDHHTYQRAGMDLPHRWQLHQARLQQLEPNAPIWKRFAVPLAVLGLPAVWLLTFLVVLVLFLMRSEKTTLLWHFGLAFTGLAWAAAFVRFDELYLRALAVW